MRRLIALALLVTAAVLVRRTMALDAAADLRDTALAFGFALIAAALAGEIFERMRLPRISGYLVFGIACGPYAGDLISRSMAVDLQQVNGLAIALIAFVAGLEMNLARLRETIGAISRLGAAVLGGSLLLFSVLLLAGWSFLPLPEVPSLAERAVIAVILALLVVSFSPTVSLAVIAESRARGPLTDLVLPLVILADLVLIVLFALLLQAARAVSGAAHEGDVGLVALLSWELLGSLAFGGLMGAAFAIYLRHVGREVTLVLLGLCVVLAGVGQALHFEIVLASLTAGLVVENIAPPEGDALKHAVERGALPVLIVFFVAAGASLQLDVLAEVGLVALVLAIARGGALWATSRAGLAWSGLPAEPGRLVWNGLVSQGGVTLGLASLVATEFASWGPPAYTLVIALTALHVLAGPVMFRKALADAGEVGKDE